MNTSVPVASEIASVDFTCLSDGDIRRLSVRQIQSPTTFENTVTGRTPVPLQFGLYDPALGACEALRQRCSTCQLDYNYCPGHLGHIALPVPVYNPTFFDQMFHLLKNVCRFCFHFRASPAEIDRYVCKLRLIQHGLVYEAQDIDQIRPKSKTSSMKGAEADAEYEVEEGDEEDIETFIARRRKEVDKLIKRNRRRVDLDSSSRLSSIAQERWLTVREFLKSALPVKKCTRCQGVSPVPRRDGYSKIFLKELSNKDAANNAQLGIHLRSALFDEPSQKRRDSNSKLEEADNEMSEVADVGEGQHEAGTVEIDGERLLASQEVEDTLKRVFQNEWQICQYLYAPKSASKLQSSSISASMFFLHSVAVPPTKFRPPQAADGELTESSSNRSLVKILQDCLLIKDQGEKLKDAETTIEQRKLEFTKMMMASATLQLDVNSFLDSNKSGVTGLAARGIEDGIKQKLEKKEGLFRKNFMGKRVNFAARSVISPDPNIETSEIGVPLVFAQKLTYPEPVTDINLEKLRSMVRNGPNKWPGAISVENENGTVQKLPSGDDAKSIESRETLANALQTPDPLLVSSRPKKVHRHLLNGDYVLMNRQPTLHKPSIMGHKARVLKKERTIRMHYANCNTYNADFDGDEMNMHLPQNAIAQAEAREIAKTDLQYLVPTSGKPLRGLIQDHLVIGVWLTNRDTMFTRSEYQQLLYSCLLPEISDAVKAATGSTRIRTLSPAILKPKPLWTGKQVITTVLENIRPQLHQGLTLNSTAKVPGDRWFKGCEEGSVIFKDGYLVSGVLDKNQIGPTEGGFVHAIYEVYGATVAGALLSILGRLLTKFLHMRAHTCGMDDLLLTEAADKRRRETLAESRSVGRELSTEYVSLKDGNFQESELLSRLEEVYRDSSKHGNLDMKANAKTATFTTKIIKQCVPDGLQKDYPRNNFQGMTVSGAKGSDVNASQISCLLGQQVLEGRRVPVMVSGKTLPCFKPYETDVRAGGYITDRFLTGVRPQEYYFHCMAGREGLIDTAVKTSRSGYLQRCLTKGMEGIKVAYDNTVRDSDGSMVQFLYGEDGLDVAKQRNIRQFKFCIQNQDSFLRQITGDHHNVDIGDGLDALSERLNNTVALSHMKKAHKRLSKARSRCPLEKNLDVAEVVISRYSPALYVGSVSEQFFEAKAKYVDNNEHGLILKKDTQSPVGHELSRGMTKGQFHSLLDLIYLKALAEPGEAVGMVAGQSIGEPSTQMTLNTFHLAGHATKNVTLGIPRLREIVMTASAKIATPTMSLTVNMDVSDFDLEQRAKRCSRLVVSQLLDNVTVRETIDSDAKKFLIRFNLYPTNEYEREYSITKTKVHKVLKALAAKLDSTVRSILKKKKAKSKTSVEEDDSLPQVGQSIGNVEEAARDVSGNDDNDSDDDADGDASDAKRASKKKELVGYEEPDAEEAEISRRLQKEDATEFNDSDDDDSDENSKGKKNEDVDSPNVTSFSFDPQGQWCEIGLEYPAESSKVLMLAIVENACKDDVIRELQGIGAVEIDPDLSKDEKEAGVRKLSVEGVNFKAFWDQQDLINPNSIMTNDIAALMSVYGVEAGRATIVREISSVFGGHGISVDNRHLNLIADAMTRGGGYTPFNRQGLKSSTSPFLKMSFETTCQFLKEAVLEGGDDDLKSPSARIVLGKLGKLGTGSHDIMVGGLE